tara:strand:- start:938 stop:1879 length:942 start_codon:yes stop_codon:yes gene_type:complete
MKLRLFTFIIIFFISSLGKSFGQINSKILLKVGNKIITNYDLQNKILTSLVLSSQEINQKNINKIKKQSIDSLIQKKIKEIELESFDYQISQNRINNYLKSISVNYSISLEDKFRQNDINYDIFLNEIKTQLKWQQHILNIYSPKIEINQEAVNLEMNNILKEKKSITEFRLSEVQISINNNEMDKSKIENLIDLINEIGFENTALKFSTSSTSEIKGDLGWINSNSLSKNILKIVNNLNVGEISQPIIRQGSATILKLMDKKKSDIENVNKDNLRKNIINNKKNELFNLYSKSLLSKLKNTTLIEYSGNNND